MNSIPNNLTAALQVVVEMSVLLNVSRVAKRLNISRVTAGRLLELAQESCGVEIFTLKGNEYELTEEGHQVVDLAKNILRSSLSFTSPVACRMGGLSYSRFTENGHTSYAQQHSINDAWKIGLPEIKASIQAWTISRGQIEADDFQPVRDRMLIMRKEFDRWIFVEIGERASMRNWLGETTVKSAIGRPVTQNPFGNAAIRYLLPPLEHVMTYGGLWYDHVSAMFPNPKNDQIERSQYQRLVMRCEFPDTSPAFVSLVCITDDIVINGLTHDAPSLTI